jgi:CIC family chloride channel protein
MQFVFKNARQVGVVHVMERLSYHQGYLPWQNAVAQFVGAILSIASGQSVGREGPGIHLGAANGSLLGQWLHLPNNSIQTLVACGSAAAIAASFNTPLAGVIFAMEVVMMEYTLRGFTPVILAAVSATAVTRLTYGDAPAFAVPAMQMGSVIELPYALVIGVVIGMLAALFIALLRLFTLLWTKMPLWSRTTLAGAITGVCALFVPGVMGIGYESVNAALLGELGLTLLLSLLVLKLIATSACIGLGIPGGLIGPTLVIGAAAGGVMGLFANFLFPGGVASHAFYAIVGMGAMMGATLQAPLAALIAILELTANPNILLPGMLAIISAGLTSSELFGQRSVFIAMLRGRGLDYRNDPIAQSLRRVGVAAVMNRNFVVSRRLITTEQADELLKQTPQWIVISGDDDEPKVLLPAADLGVVLQQQREKPDAAAQAEAEIDLMAIPAHRRELMAIHLQATLQEALDRLEENKLEVLFVRRKTKPGKPSGVYGVLSRQDIEANYRYNPGP